jgi:type II secretory pathway pseudopilin PulG
MVFLIGIAAVVAAAVLSYWLAASAGRRQLAEQRAALAAELAALTRDNEWLKTQVDRERDALGTMREAFQSLAADVLHTNRTAFLESLDSRQKAFDGLVQPIAEALKKVDVKLSEAERERLEAYARLTE